MSPRAEHPNIQRLVTARVSRSTTGGSLTGSGTRRWISGCMRMRLCRDSSPWVCSSIRGRPMSPRAEPCPVNRTTRRPRGKRLFTVRTWIGDVVTGSRTDSILEYLRREITRRREEIDKDRTLKSMTFRIVLDHDGNPHCIEYQKTYPSIGLRCLLLFSFGST